MTKDEALKLALKALEEYVNVVVSVNDPNEWTPKVADAGEPARKAITAIKQVLANDALEKKAENARELGLDYKQAQRTWVGLTDEEIDDLSRTMVKGNKSVNWLCQAIETALKEKNA